jgi:hypothetical protein
MITFDTNVAAQNATTQYLNFDYNSLTKVGKQFFCASENGLYRIAGSSEIFPADDDTTEIVESYFELATMDFGLSNQKRLRAAYIGYEADGDLTLKISTELVSAVSYTLPATTAGQHARRVSLSRTLKGRYWTFQIYGNGVNYAIDMIQVLPIIRGHGIDQN